MLSGVDAATWLPRLIETSLRTIPVLLPPAIAARISSKPLPPKRIVCYTPLKCIAHHIWRHSPVMSDERY